MQRWIFAVYLVSLSLVLGLPLANAQGGNSFCVSAFEDFNKNLGLDGGEPYFAGISVYIMAQEVIIQSHVTTAEARPFCFEGLADGTYTVVFAETPNYIPLMETRATLPLANGERRTAQLPVTANNLFADPAPQVATEAELSTGARLGLATLGASIVFMLMLGLGVLVAGILY